MDELNRKLHDEFRRMNAVLHRGKKGRRRDEQQGREAGEGSAPNAPSGDGWHGHMHDPHRGNRAISQYRVLVKLLESDGISQRDLTMLMGVRPQSTGELIDKLEAAGLVQRRRSDVDRRVVNIFLTESGREKAMEMHSHNISELDSIFSPLSAEEKQQLLALLRKLNEANNASPARE